MENYASYRPGTFTINASRFEVGKNLFHPRDMPAFFHEYCHYIQDVTTISAIFGFTLWLFDVVNLTRIFSDGEGKTIMLPLPPDEHGDPINKYRKFYNLFCGDANDVHHIDYQTIRFNRVEFEIKPLDVGSWQPLVRFNRIIMDNRSQPLEFRLIALQEIHACYAQQITEHYYPDEDFPVAAADLPSYPYHFGDHLFEVYGVTIPLQAKFLLVGLCLDTVQAPTTFLLALELIKGQSFTTDQESVDRLIVVVEQARVNCSYATEDALEQILPDLENWANGPGRPEFRVALEWYIMQIEMSYKMKKDTPIIFHNLFCHGIGGLSDLYQLYPVPVFYNNGALDGNASPVGETAQYNIYLFSFEAGSTFWALRELYDFLCARDIATLLEKSTCPLYEKCTVRPQLGEDYTCKSAPWEIVKNKVKAPCHYGLAAASMGLWQNSIGFDWE